MIAGIKALAPTKMLWEDDPHTCCNTETQGALLPANVSSHHSVLCQGKHSETDTPAPCYEACDPLSRMSKACPNHSHCGGSAGQYPGQYPLPHLHQLLAIIQMMVSIRWLWARLDSSPTPTHVQRWAAVPLNII